MRVSYWKFLKITSKNNHKIVKILGNKMCLSFNDLGISKALLIDRIREVDATKEIQKILNEGDVVLDIGANIGYFVLLESKIIGNKGKVFAVEPIPSNFEMLNKNIELNNYQNIQTYNFAFGEEKGVDILYLTEMSNQASLLKNTVFKDSGFGDF